MVGLQHLFLMAAALYGFLGVLAGAFGAHLLKSKLSPDLFDVLEVAVRYQMYHALALLGVALFLGTVYSPWIVVAGWLFLFGVILFSGSLYMLVFSGVRAWGAITPIGGLFLLGGWGCLLLAALLTPLK